ncbi:hypothetical protein [Listeria sp. PSOL-1]|uniref:hypothetical protein n=1 Tax=Listeria sp. PSOL-1 TaxID=1844999 RepID=UPI0013D8C3EC|nr:hypothetical protein [Listeria sp. PSOL-1]
MPKDLATNYAAWLKANRYGIPPEGDTKVFNDVTPHASWKGFAIKGWRHFDYK